jgi:hypothetical protein
MDCHKRKSLSRRSPEVRMIMSSGGQRAEYMFSDSESTLIESELVLAVLLLLLLLSVLARV